MYGIAKNQEKKTNTQHKKLVKGDDPVDEHQQVVFQLILHAGNGKSAAMEAIAFSKKGEYQEAIKKMEECKQELNEAHHIQTSLIQKETRGEKNELSLLMVHAQDHLMNAITTKDLANDMIELYKLVREVKIIK